VNPLDVANVLAQLMSRWESGVLDELQVLSDADDLDFTRPWSRTGETSAIDEDPALDLVLAHLSALHVDLVTRDDIPALRDLISSIGMDPVDGVHRWEAYRGSIDWRARAQGLLGDPLYDIGAQIKLGLP
jgi:hypothetical protein